MLQEICEYIHNYFLKTPNPGKYTIADGAITPLPDLKEGQRLWIVGSDLNDGVYTYHENGLSDDDDNEGAKLRDEFFCGSIGSLAVPPAVIALADEIKKWVETYQEDVVNSPYASESFNGYSYTLKAGGTSSGGNDSVSWQSIFGKRLERWRRPYL